MQLQNIKLAVIGLGYVGLPLAVEFGRKRPVVGLISAKNELMNCKRETILRWKLHGKSWRRQSI